MNKTQTKLEAQIEHYIKELYGEKPLKEREFHVELNLPLKHCIIQIEQEGEYVDMSFKRMKELSEIFGTDNIDVNDWSRMGCETCDHGSCYTVKFDIKEVDLHKLKENLNGY